MGLFNKIFKGFTPREEVDVITVLEDLMDDDIENDNDNNQLHIVEGDGDSQPMVRTDNFDGWAITLEEYRVNDDNDSTEEFVPEAVAEIGVNVVAGDDMTPIIMDVPEENTAKEEVLETVDAVETIEPVLEEQIEIIEEMNQEEEIEIL